MTPFESMPPLLATAARAEQVLSADGKARVAAFLEGAHDPCGGFRNRAGKPDLYYTVFGIGSCIALRRSIPSAGIVRNYLDDYWKRQELSFVELVSWIRCDGWLGWSQTDAPANPGNRRGAIRKLREYRTSDGGFSHERKHAAHGTAYAVFLVVQAYRDAGLEVPFEGDIAAALDLLRTRDGGYSNHPGMRRGVTTATASAAALYARVGEQSKAQAALAYMETLRCPNGGYRASPGTREADLLSTATALYARVACGRQPLAGAAVGMTECFVESLWSDGGGFRGHPADAVTDLEYTFYALLALGSCQALQDSDRSASTSDA